MIARPAPEAYMSESVSAPRRSKTTTAASFSVVMLVSYLALVHLKAILMPLAIAILLYFLIRAPEKFLFEKVGNSVISYALILAFSMRSPRRRQVAMRLGLGLLWSRLLLCGRKTWR